MSDLEKRITAKMILDDSGYSSTLRGINSELKNNQSELKVARSGLEAFGQTTENVSRVQTTLQKQLDLQNKKLETYKSSIEKATNTLEQNISKRDELTKSLAKAEKAHESAIKTYGKESKEAKETGEALEKLEQEHEKASRTVENNAKTLQNYETQLNKTEGEINKTQSAINKFNRELENTNGFKSTAKQLEEVGTKFETIGNKAQSVGSTLTTHVSLPLSGIAYAAGKVGMDFESNMSRVQAISGATGSQFDKLEDQALSLGASTAFSANECAEGMENLASAGFTTNEIMSAMPGTLDASAASGEDLASTTEIMTGTLRGFGLEASKAGHVADVLARNAADTNAAIKDTGEAMKYIAPVAHSAGQSLEEVTAAVGILADANIKGSQAGTTLRSSLSRLADPSKEAAGVMEDLGFKAFDSHGKMLPLNEIIGNLEKSTKGLTDQQKQAAISTIFGQEAMSGMLVLMDAGPGKINELTSSLKASDGAAKDMATTMQDNTKASIEQAFGALETAGIKALKAAAPAIKSVAEDIGHLADCFSNLSPGTQEFIVKMGMVAIAAGPVTSAFGGILKTGGLLIQGGSKLAGTLGLVSTASSVATTATAAVGVAAEGTAVATAGAGVAVGGLGTTLVGLALPIAVAVAGVAAIGYAGYKTAEYLNSSATPAIDLFANKTEATRDKFGNYAEVTEKNIIKISESTKKSVGSYLELDKKASESLMNLKMNSDKFTKQTKDSVIKNFTEMSKQSSNLSKEQREKMTVDFTKLVSDTGVLTKKNKDEIVKQYTAMVNGTKGLTKKQKDQTIKDFTDTLNQSTGVTKKQSEQLQKLYTDMGTKIKSGLDKKRNDELKSQEDFFSKSNALTTKEEAQIISDTEKHWNKKKTQIDKYQNQINEIIKKASDEHRQISDAESKTIDDIQKKMKENAVKTLASNEVESRVILERMKDYDGNITAEMASKHIKELNKSRDESVKAANDECDKRIAEIIRMQKETGVISEDQANKLISDAKKQRDETVKAAGETRDQAVDKITNMNSTIKKDVDTTTGNVKSNWDKLKDSWNNGWGSLVKNFFVNTFFKSHGEKPGGNWTGNSHFEGGLTYLHERGYELYDLPTGTKVYNHESSEQMVLETAKQTAKGVIESMMSDSGNSNGDIIIPISIAGEEIDRVVVPRVSNKLALNTMRRR